MGLRGKAIATEVVSPILCVDWIAGTKVANEIVPDLVGGCFVKSQFLKRVGSLGDLAPFAIWKASRDTHEYHPPVKIASVVWISGLPLDGPGPHHS